MRNFPPAVMQKWAFYVSVILGITVLFSFQNCGKVKFDTSRTSQALVVPQSCGSISMSPQSGLYQDTNVTFNVIPPNGITILNLSWDFTKGAKSVFTSNSNPVSHQFNSVNEGIGDYVATATFIKSDGNGCELTQSFQILVGDLCADPSGISGPTIGFAGEETSPFSVNAEACFQGTVAWDMDNDGIAEYNVGVDDSITHIYIVPGTYTVNAIVINADDNSKTILTQTITIKYANCTNGANNPPNCDQCIPDQVLVDNQCVGNCTNGATNPPTCNTCPAGKTLIGGQCVGNCTNGAINPPTCNTCSVGQILQGGQCVVAPCTNGAINPPTCNTCSVGQILQGGQCVPGTCALPWGGTINQGQSVTAYQNSSVAYGQTCVSQSRTCSAGVLSGSYTNKTCTVTAGANCSFNGQTVVNGSSVTAYQSSSVAYGGTCKSETRTCTNGSLSGSFGSTSCTVTAAAACTLPWGGSIAHGQSVVAYAASSVACGSTCSAETRACNNGTLTGSNSNQACTAVACVPGSCGSSNGKTLTSIPTTNLCSSGSVSAVEGSGPWTWSCVGSGSTANCSASKDTIGDWNCSDGYSTSCGYVLVDDGHINRDNPGYAIIITSPNPSNGAPNQHCGCSQGTRVKVGPADCTQLIQYYRCDDAPPPPKADCPYPGPGGTPPPECQPTSGGWVCSGSPPISYRCK